MAWYGHDKTTCEIEAEACRKEADKLNEANRHAKEEQAGGYHCITQLPRR
jgi:hypothetical protein